jgi:hypothetical protein
MRVDKEIHALSQEILDMFDASRIKQNQINEVKKESTESSNKWATLEKQMDQDDKVQELKDKDHEQEVQDKMHKMMGCNQDH